MNRTGLVLLELQADAGTYRDVAKRIQAEMTYPGEIRVTVLREIRAVDFAR